MTTLGKTKKIDLFKEIYLGEYVEIVMDYSSEGPMIMHGFILDYDDNEIYLGETPDAINMSIPRFGYKLMVISSPTDEFHDIMGMEKPKAEEIN